MRLSKREVVLLSLVLIVAGGGLYFTFFFTPTMARISELEIQIPELQMEIADAEMRQVIYEGALIRLEEMQEQWDEYYAEYLPPRFDDTDILPRIQRLVYPRTLSLTIDFERLNVDLGADMFITSVPLSFETTYPQFMEILNLLTQEGIDNRVVSYTMSRGDNMEIIWSVDMLLEFLTLNEAEEEEPEEMTAEDRAYYYGY